jgi:hypothetical protein
LEGRWILKILKRIRTMRILRLKNFVVNLAIGESLKRNTMSMVGYVDIVEVLQHSEGFLHYQAFPRCRVI